MDTVAEPADPGPRPDLRDARAPSGRGWLPTLAVLAVIVVVVFGGFVVAAWLSEPVGAPVAVDDAASVQPLSGWEVVARSSVGGRPYVQLTRGSGNLIVVDWGPVAADAGALAADVTDQLLTPRFSQLSVSDSISSVTLSNGRSAARFTFLGVDPESGGSIEGEVTATVSPTGEGVVFIGLAPEGSLAFVDGDIHTMVDDTEVA